jgi:hypothetical protein
MKGTVKIHIRELLEGVYPAPVEEIRRLVAQGSSALEPIQIALDLAG